MTDGFLASHSISKSAYVPPHLRATTVSTPPMGNSWNGPRNSPTASPIQRAYLARFSRPGLSDWSSRPVSTTGAGNWRSTPSRDSQSREVCGQAYRRDGKHIVGSRNVEQDLFGDMKDPSKQCTAMNFDDIPVSTGADVPAPIPWFVSVLAFDTAPALVRKYSIPMGSTNRDLMDCAQTGADKTAGSFFPILSPSFVTGPSPPPAQSQAGYPHARKAPPTTHILAPTRELVSEIHEEARKFSYRSWVCPAVDYGGADINQQLRPIERGCDPPSGTPGRLVDLIEHGRTSLGDIHNLTPEEAGHGHIARLCLDCEATIDPSAKRDFNGPGVYPATSACPSSNTSLRQRHPTYQTNTPHVPPDSTSSTPIVMPKSPMTVAHLLYSALTSASLCVTQPAVIQLYVWSSLIGLARAAPVGPSPQAPAREHKACEIVLPVLLSLFVAFLVAAWWVHRRHAHRRHAARRQGTPATCTPPRRVSVPDPVYLPLTRSEALSTTSHAPEAALNMANALTATPIRTERPRQKWTSPEIVLAGLSVLLTFVALILGGLSLLYAQRAVSHA